MANLWKYCTPAHCEEFLLSLGLISDSVSLGALYAVARHASRHYASFTLTGRNGASRHILAPDPLLKSLQRTILRNVLRHRPVSPHAAAYRPSRGIAENAALHKGQRFVLRLDIRRFFDSIRFADVYRSAFPRHLFPPAVAGLLTALCCYEGRLPQGAPTSPAISNLILRPFDGHMGEWCARRGIRYSRYCDDMVFSGDFDYLAVLRKVRGFLRALGFCLHEEKTRLQSRAARQSVTGITVNERPQVSRQYRRSLRQEIYYCLKFGAASHVERIGGNPSDAARHLRSLLGKVGFVLQVRPDDAEFLQAKQALLAQAFAGCSTI